MSRQPKPANSLRKLLEDPFGPYPDYRILNPEWPRKSGSVPRPVLTSVHMKCGGRSIGLDETELLKEAPSSSRIAQHNVETFGVLEIEKLNWLTETGKRWLEQDLRKRDDDFKTAGKASQLSLETVYGDGVNSGSTISVWLKFDKILSATYMTLDEDPTLLVLQAADRNRSFCIGTLDVEVYHLSRNFLERYRMRRVIHELIDGSNSPIEDRDIDWLVEKYLTQEVAMDKHFRIIYNPNLSNAQYNKRGDLRLSEPRHTRTIHTSQIREMFARQAEWILADQVVSLSPNARYLNIKRWYKFVREVRKARRMARGHGKRWGEPWNRDLYGIWAVQRQIDWTKFGGTQEDWKRLLKNARNNPAPRFQARDKSQPTPKPWLPPTTRQQVSLAEPLTQRFQLQGSSRPLPPPPPPPAEPVDFQYDSDFSEASTDPETSEQESDLEHDPKLAREMPWYYSVPPTLESTQHTWRCPFCNNYQLDLLKPEEDELEILPVRYADLLRLRQWTTVTDPDVVTAFGHLVNNHYKQHLAEVMVQIVADEEKGTSVRKVAKEVKGKKRKSRNASYK
ncbi:hypothetical protein AGABI2DRAFT_115068 [Agaricus bisporus var. bisporus H97]|uniref:hypothetical protein n=1 Tax=Agaricus bisporus var. bisporus (strain H97 / ATCC MYA-4626 / FGSC 10389) TaxID=936046 RepID=UPI00029F5CFC|nr:hypothetical protein AGABI2DRAFT_115068 [Agaricus bisporus var. bisporus H97]EKV50003.1 hypothetical protein AGABI2DRAFT_115068 [Agaricus bisporus var. bisporus H97]